MRRLFAWSLPIFSALLVSGAVLAAEKSSKTPTFGVLSAPTEAVAREQAAQWLRDAGKTDADSLKAFDAIWSQTETRLLDKVAATFALGDADAAKLLAEARDPNAPAPLEVPSIVKNAKSTFFKANFAVAYARALSNLKIYEESLETLRLVKPEQTIDPASHLFHKAVAEHALMLKKEADDS